MDYKMFRVVALALAICFVFALVINNAYKYLPENSNMKAPLSVEDINSQIEGETEEKNIDSFMQLQEELNNLRQEKDDLEQRLSEAERNRDNEPYREIPDNSSEINGEFETLYADGEKLLAENNLDEALNRFNEAITKASSDKQTAKAYLGLAKVYALKQRYGSAFSNAQKAHNLYPTYESHLLIAKLNFKTGQAAKAEQSIKRVLEKDFSSDFR